MGVTLDQAPQFIKDKINAIVEKAKKESLYAAGNTMLAVMKDRIFDEGKDSNEASIGTYSTKPTYVVQKQFVNKGSFKPQGKTGEKKFKEGAKKGQAHKSMYLPSGYKQLRQIQGRPTNVMNWNYSSSLLRAIQLVKNGDHYAVAIVEAKESKKFRGNEKKANKTVGAASENEVKIFQEAFIDHLTIEIDNTFK